MRESNFNFPSQNRASVCISSAIYDRRGKISLILSRPFLFPYLQPFYTESFPFQAASSNHKKKRALITPFTSFGVRGSEKGGAKTEAIEGTREEETTRPCTVRRIGYFLNATPLPTVLFLHPPTSGIRNMSDSPCY